MNWTLRLLWSLWALPWVLFITVLISGLVVLAGLCGVKEKGLQSLAHAWGRALLAGIGCRVKVLGRENLTAGKPYVFVCNHSSALDIPILFVALPENLRWIAKKELFKIPLFGPAMAASGYVPIDRSHRRAAMRSLEVASARIRAGASVVIFPEGTRSQNGRLGEFKSGGFLLALKALQPLVPVLIAGSNRLLPPHRFLLWPGIIEVRIGQPIEVADMDIKERDTLALSLRAKVLAMARPGEID